MREGTKLSLVRRYGSNGPPPVPPPPPPANPPSTWNQRFPPTNRREQAVATLLAMGWQWTGEAWVPPSVQSMRRAAP